MTQHQPSCAAGEHDSRTAVSVAMSSLRKHRIFVLVPVHVLILALSYLAAFLLRFDGAPPAEMWHLLVVTLPYLVAVKMGVLFWWGTLGGSFRFVSFSDLVSLAQACLLASAIVICVDYFAVSSLQVPRSVVAIDFCLSLLLLGSLRGGWRFAAEHLQPIVCRRQLRNALVIGANNEGQRYVQFLRAALGDTFDIVGCLDNDPSSRRTRLGGVPVLGSIQQLQEIAQRQHAKHLFVISGSLPGSEIRALMEVCRRDQIVLKMIPPVAEMLAGSFQRRIRDVDINDLLRRDPVVLDNELVSPLLGGRGVMVTGAGGSIGSELCRQVARCGPSRLILVERAENSLFRIEQELLGRNVPLEAVLADVTDARHMEEVFAALRPEVVLHAAAHKHVPLMERHPALAIQNNVLGTKVVADLAAQFGVERFVQISTDKAVRPSSVMGATKFLAEKYVSALGQTAQSTRFVVVRFGNVLASDGSVVPTFQRQIAQGGPITITDARMTRYFMTIPEAAQLVLHAAGMGKGGEIFVLDMGQPVRIIDLARDMVRLSGHSVEEIEIKVVGIRPGEKLDEELNSEDEQLLSTRHPRISACYVPPLALDDIERTVGELTLRLHDAPDVVCARLHEVVRQYAGVLLPAGFDLVEPSESEPLEAVG